MMQNIYFYQKWLFTFVGSDSTPHGFKTQFDPQLHRIENTKYHLIG